jgi:hypothetical protein
VTIARFRRRHSDSPQRLRGFCRSGRSSEDKDGGMDASQVVIRAAVAGPSAAHPLNEMRRLRRQSGDGTTSRDAGNAGLELLWEAHLADESRTAGRTRRISFLLRPSRRRRSTDRPAPRAPRQDGTTRCWMQLSAGAFFFGERGPIYWGGRLKHAATRLTPSGSIPARHFACNRKPFLGTAPPRGGATRPWAAAALTLHGGNHVKHRPGCGRN